MKTYVISDIHGCSRTLKKMIDQIGLNKSDQLYFLGDYIDKGKDGAGVIDFILSLKEEGFQVFPLKGNHEHNLIHAYETYEESMFLGFVRRINKSGCLLDENGKLIEKYKQFCSDLPYYYELDKFWLVHAGFDTRTDDILTNQSAMLEQRAFEYKAHLLKGKTVIHGHHVAYFQDIKNDIENRNKIIHLDNGCVYSKPHKVYDHLQTGNLLCLELNTWDLTVVKNCENE